ncbi:MAG: two-component sensor histidine kinase [Oxalobacteraceae bacterium]|nr:MAG: two-component sensor histidine kinase [Oxalobacteraceae bacterium]
MNFAASLPQPRTRETLWRTLQTFNVTRIAIAVVLLVYLTINARQGFWLYEGFLYRETCAAYLVLAIGFAVVTAWRKRQLMLQLSAGIVADLVMITILYVAAGGARSGLAILYLFPLAGSAVLAPMMLALFFAALVALAMLLESAYQLLNIPADSTISQAGLYGGAFFAAVYVLNRLAGRLIRQEQLAIEHRAGLQVQQAINQLVIVDMGDGVLVTGRDTTIFTVNPAAERMLGLAGAHSGYRGRLDDVGWLAPIAEAFFSWDRDAAGTRPAFVVLKPAEGPTVHLRLRFASIGTVGDANERVVVFLQNVSEIEDRAQELKLASMGRLTASIAHEVRNPLSAIGHAGSLLGEDATDPVQRRLVHIINDNVSRLDRMIEDILRLSRKAQPGNEPVRLATVVPEMVEEFRDAHALRPGLIHVGALGDGRVLFDPLHLREVVVNLLSNAMRYASGRDASIRLFMVTDAARRCELHVQDDGVAITPEVRAHLFEPFYTTSSKGTGLGLYLARELCMNNGAMLDYEYRSDSWNQTPADASGRFVITLATPDT